MARRKKTASMPQADKEKLLKKAIVSEDEQPYKVPGNWCWTYIKGFAECLDSFRQPVNTRERSLRSGDIPYYGATGQVGWIDAYLIDSHVVLLGEDGAPFLDFFKNKAYIIEGKSWVNNHAHILRSYFGKIGNAFLMHYLNVFDYSKYVKGSTRLKLTQSSMNEIPVPLPPLQEQQRIVERIESLFSKLDAAKERIQNALDGCELRKAAMLKKAFNGELTEKWRKEHGEDLKSWQECSIAQLCSALQYGTSNKSQPSGEVAVLRMGNLQNGEIDWTDLVYTDNQQDIKKYSLVPGDVLFNRTNSAALVGKTSIYRGEQKAIFAGYLIKLDYYRDKVLGDFLNYALNTTNAREYCNRVKTDGVNQSNINAQKIGAYTITVPTMPEQKEIVRILDGFFEKERTAKEAAEQALEQIEYIKKSILAKAFRGELGTNAPQEESSLELLKQIIETGNN